LVRPSLPKRCILPSTLPCFSNPLPILLHSCRSPSPMAPPHYASPPPITLPSHGVLPPHVADGHGNGASVFLRRCLLSAARGTTALCLASPVACLPMLPMATGVAHQPGLLADLRPPPERRPDAVIPVASGQWRPRCYLGGDRLHELSTISKKEGRWYLAQRCRGE